MLQTKIEGKGNGIKTGSSSRVSAPTDVRSDPEHGGRCPCAQPTLLLCVSQFACPSAR